MGIISTILTITTSFLFGRYEANKKAHPLTDRLINPGRTNRNITLVIFSLTSLCLIVLLILKIRKGYSIINWGDDLIVEIFLIVILITSFRDKDYLAEPLPHVRVDNIEYYILSDLGNGYLQVIDTSYNEHHQFKIMSWSYFKNCEFDYKVFPK